MEERQSYLWQEANHGYSTKWRAGHAYETQRPAAGGRWNRGAPTLWRSLAAILIGMPITVMVVRLVAVALFQ